MPDPAWVTVPDPVMTFEKVAASVRLNVRAALLTTEAVPSVPEVEPAPTWTVPDEIVNTPEKELVPSTMRVFVPAPAVLAKPPPALIWLTFLRVPDWRLSVPIRVPVAPIVLLDMSKVPPFRVTVLFTVPEVLV